MKKDSKAKKAICLTLQRETLHQLDDWRLKTAAGGGRLRVPIGFADDTTPLYDETGG